jgi:hypothetical protein
MQGPSLEDLDAELEEDDRTWEEEQKDPNLVRRRMWRTFEAEQLAPLAFTLALLLICLVVFPLIWGPWSVTYWVFAIASPILAFLLAVQGYLVVRKFLYLRHIVPVSGATLR